MTSYKDSLLVKYQRLLNPFNVPSVQVVMAEPMPGGATEIVSIPFTDVKESTEVLAVVYFDNKLGRHGAKPEVVVWGFVSMSRVREQGALALDEGKLVLHHEWSRRTLPSSVTIPLHIHESFDFYKDIDAKLNGEASTDALEKAVLGRLALYRSVLHHTRGQNWVEALSSPEDVVKDYMGFAAVVASLVCVPIMSYESRQPLFQTWLNIESRLARLRIAHCKKDSLLLSGISSIVREYTETALKGTSLQRRLMGWKPLTRTFYATNFERAAPILGKRDCIVLQGRVYFTLTELPYVVHAYIKARLHDNAEKAKVNGQDTIQYLTPFMKRLLKKCVMEMHGLHEQMHFGSSLTTQVKQPKKMPLAAIIQSAPRCIQELHRMAIDRSTKVDRLKNSARLGYAQYLVMMGWKSADIQAYWRPKIEIAYEGDESTSVMKEVKSTVNWLQRNRSTHSYRCSYFMDKHLCPLSQQLGSGMEAAKACAKHLDERLASSKLTPVRRDGQGVLHLSPVEFTRIALESYKDPSSVVSLDF
jgi:hypothetical protein